jgi:hypothetical protein
MLIEKMHQALKITVWLDSYVPQFILTGSPLNKTVVHVGWCYTMHSKHLGLSLGHFQSTCDFPLISLSWIWTEVATQ